MDTLIIGLTLPDKKMNLQLLQMILVVFPAASEATDEVKTSMLWEKIAAETS